jgi:hypothetical protein
MPDDLVRLCTIPVNGVLTAEHDDAGWIFEARILRPLGWFGLLEVETKPDEEMRFLKHRRYRKSATFDAFISFEVALEAREGTVQ